MSQCLRRLSGIMAAIACMAFLVVPAFAGDPQDISASPAMLPGANQSVCDSIERNAVYNVQQNMTVHINTLQQPTSMSACMQALIKQAAMLNNLFSDSFSFQGLIQTATQGLMNQVEQQACQQVSGLMGPALQIANHGAISSVSINNIFGRALPGQLSAALSVSPNSGGSCPSAYPVLLNGKCVTQATATADPSGDDLDSGDDDNQPDDMDNIANSMGTTVTAMAEDSPTAVSGLIQDPAPNAADTTIPPPTTYTLPTTSGAPNNNTICIPPDPRNDIPRDLAVLNAMGDSDLANPADIYNPNAVVDDDPDLTGSPQPTPNPILPRTDTPNLGDAPTGQTALVPAGVEGTAAGCNPLSNVPTSAQMNGPFPKTGTPCTANTQLSCMAGSNSSCSIQNGTIGIMRDFQNSGIFSGGYVGDGECAVLTENLVPNLGHQQSGTGVTNTWRQGAKVKGNTTLPFGTPIATFFGPAPTPQALTHAGSPIYEFQPCPSKKCTPSSPSLPNIQAQHTGIYFGQTKSCLFLLEQWGPRKGPPARAGNPPHIRCLPWNGNSGVGQWPGSVNPLTKANSYENAGINYYVITHQ